MGLVGLMMFLVGPGNKLIFETIYHAALEQSMEISKTRASYMGEIRKKLNDGQLNIIDGKIHFDMNQSFNLEEADECMRAIERMNVIQEELEGERSTCSEDLLGSYSSFIGSPASKGELQFDMWDVLLLIDMIGIN